MDIAGAYAATAQARTQIALASTLTKMNIEADQAVASLIEQAAANLEAVVAAAPPGAGLAIDVSV